jgi:surfeit locus 1 family protein
MTRRGLFWPAVMTVIALPILIGLGVWQLQRLEWKTGLLDRLRAAIAAGVSRPAAAQDFAEFELVEVSGVFDHARERYVFTSRNAQAGYLVFTPLRPSGCAVETCEVWVNRGFVTAEKRDPAVRPTGQIEGEVRVRGMARRPEANTWFAPSPDAARNIWFATSFLSAPYIEADATPNPGGWPRGRDAKSFLSSIPNNHAAYAFTWFSLAVILAITFGAYVHSRRNEAA